MRTWLCVLDTSGGSGWAHDLLTKIVGNLTVRIHDFTFRYIEDEEVACTVKVGELVCKSMNEQWKMEMVVTHARTPDTTHSETSIMSGLMGCEYSVLHVLMM